MTDAPRPAGADERGHDGAGAGARRPDATQTVTVRIDGQTLHVAPGTLVAAAVAMIHPARGARVSPGGTRRQAFCGMGVCGECRVTIAGRAHRLGCEVVCTPGMEIRSDG